MGLQDAISKGSFAGLRIMMISEIFHWVGKNWRCMIRLNSMVRKRMAVGGSSCAIFAVIRSDPGVFWLKSSLLVCLLRILVLVVGKGSFGQDFQDLSQVWENEWMKSCLGVRLKDPLQVLGEGIRFVRCIPNPMSIFLSNGFNQPFYVFASFYNFP